MTIHSTSGVGNHLDHALAALSRGLEAHRRRDHAAARGAYLQAAEALTKAAQGSPEPLRTARLAQAERLLALARSLGQGQARPAAKSPDAKAPDAKLPAADPDGKAAQWLVAERPDIRLDDVAGLEEVKEQIRLSMVYPFTHPELAQKFRIRRGGGILLYGPPGTGKTLLARAAAGELEAAFFVIKPSDVLAKWFGEAEGNVAALFTEARRYPRAVIFIDEIEGMVPKRGTTNSSVMPRVVGQFLQELEGFQGRSKERALLFLGATNEPWLLDEAIMRPGRFDVKIHVPLPDEAARLQILQMNLKGKPLDAALDLADVARRTQGYSGADLRAVADYATVLPFREAVRTGTDRLIALPDVERALERIRPSVSPQAVGRFERWQREQGG
jgi:transitional endoplasmic reticulum ATPase